MSYGMFTDAGNKKVANLTKRILKLPITATDQDIYNMVTEGLNKIGGEAWDTEVREAIISRIEKETNRDLTIYF